MCAYKKNRTGIQLRRQNMAGWWVVGVTVVVCMEGASRAHAAALMALTYVWCRVRRALYGDN